MPFYDAYLVAIVNFIKNNDYGLVIIVGVTATCMFCCEWLSTFLLPVLSVCVALPTHV